MNSLIVYGHEQCPMVLPVRQVLDAAGIVYQYINIHQDEDARQRVRAINSGNESVPTLVFADETTLEETTLTEPSIRALRRKLEAAGYTVSDRTAASAQLQPYLSIILGIGLGVLVGAAVGDAGTGLIIGTGMGFAVNLLRTHRAGR